MQPIVLVGHVCYYFKLVTTLLQNHFYYIVLRYDFHFLFYAQEIPFSKETCVFIIFIFKPWTHIIKVPTKLILPELIGDYFSIFRSYLT